MTSPWNDSSAHFGEVVVESLAAGLGSISPSSFAPLTSPPRPTLHDCSNPLCISASDLSLDFQSNDSVILPGYSTPQRTSALLQFPPPSNLSSEADSSFGDQIHTLQHYASCQEGFSNPITDYVRNKKKLAQTDGGADTPNDYPLSSPSNLPSLPHKPKLSKTQSFGDSMRVKSVSDPFAMIDPSAEVAWDSIVLEASRPLGDGNEGSVILAKYMGTQVAVKLGNHERIVREQKMMAHLKHPHIVRTLGHATRRSSRGGDLVHYAAIYEYCHNRDLMTYLNTEDIRTDVPKMTQIFDDILAGLEYLHSYQNTRLNLGPVVHGDVKPENIMIDREGKAKIGDFGLAQYESTGMDVQGTPSYIAPEVVLDFLAGSSNPQFTTKADIFSFGVMMVVTLTGHYPFKRLTAKLHSGQMSKAQVIKHFTPSRRTLQTINDISPRFKRIVDACLNRYPEMRPTATQLRNLLFRRSKSTGEESGLIKAHSLSMSTQMQSSINVEDDVTLSKTQQSKAAQDKVKIEPSLKVPASLAHIVQPSRASYGKLDAELD